MWLWVKTLHPQMDVHPAQDGIAIGYAPWPCFYMTMERRRAPGPWFTKNVRRCQGDSGWTVHSSPEKIFCAVCITSMRTHGARKSLASGFEPIRLLVRTLYPLSGVEKIRFGGESHTIWWVPYLKTHPEEGRQLFRG